MGSLVIGDLETMPEIPDVWVTRLQQITDEYKTSEGVTAQEQRLYVWFHDCLFNEIGRLGGVERGYTFRQSSRGTMLIYKATFEEVHQVVFVTAHDPIRCIQIFCRKFYAETLDWVTDKYA